MSVDTNTPKGCRKAWNGGKPPTEVPETRDFHAHLDNCRQCREHPFALCEVGALLMHAAITKY